MRKCWVLCALAFVNFGWSNPAPRWGMVDMQAVFSASLAGKDIDEQMKVKKDQYQEEIAKQEAALKKNEALLKSKDTKSKEYASQVKVFQEDMGLLQQKVQLYTESLERAYREAMTSLEKEVLRSVESVRKSENIAVVFAKEKILGFDPHLIRDLTDLVKKTLNKNCDRMPLVFQDKAAL